MSKMTMRRIGALELFGGCRRSQLARIDRLGVTLDVPPRKVLCVEGATGAEFFALVDGFADVRTSTGTFALLRPGAWFGEVALLDGSPRRATVTTRTESTLMVFGRREFATLLTIAPEVRARLRRSASLVAQAAMPTREPWYQPIPSRLALALVGTR